MTPLKEFYEKQAQTIIKNLEKRNMEGYYFADSESAVKKALSLMGDGQTVAWGGSMTLTECGLMDALPQSSLILWDRDTAKTPEEKHAMQRQAFTANYYLMSTNAITLDGQLVNVDGNGNRVAALAYGPDHVIMMVGMNKVSVSLEEAMKRIRNMAAPPNTTRLNMKTPCYTTGVCHDCLSPDCICAHTIITRYNRSPGRIKVLLIGETLGY